MEQSTPVWFGEVMGLMARKCELCEPLMEQVMADLVAGFVPEVETAAFLVSLRMKGETAGELAAAARVLRRTMVALDLGRSDLLDTCGTGGDQTGTFNISTATAIVAAAAGVPVVKHGNRAVSSSSGSSDVLTALGVRLPEDAVGIQGSLERAGLAFCFAPHFHPALRSLARIRKQLRIRTIFNCLGPLANPAGAAYQLLGVSRPELLDSMAGALSRLGGCHAFLVCGQDGLDEVGLQGTTQVREVRGESINILNWEPADFGLDPCHLSQLQVGSADESAAVIRAVLSGDTGPAGRIVLANSAAALMAADRARTPQEGVALARNAIQSGAASSVLARLIECSKASK